ncbi:MAG: alpha/beta fold hydrolase [Myxococcales bacterium]|nr:alpha/beta fold hydrolase [Myxococcales bacterium]
MDDGSGDVLLGSLDVPAGGDGAGRPLVVLIHGLSGCEDSAYLQASAAHWNERGHRALRLNLRGAGPSREHCRKQYHAGKTEDLAAALRGLPEGLDRDGLFLVGYSLGGNMLLKFLAEHGDAFPIVGAASVSAPIDLAESSRNFLRPRNRIYHAWLLSSMRSEALGAGSGIDAAEARAVGEVASIWEFDDRFVAPRNGFRDAEHYYAENRALRFMPAIRVPTLVVHALDDPWIPGRLYTGFDWSGNPSLRPLLPAGGGHVGFHARDHRDAWHDRCIARFLALLAGAARPEPAREPAAATLRAS